MPMVKDFIPRRMQPWLYIVFAVIFQMVGGVYMGSMQQMVGEWSVMREDVTFIAMCGIVGVAMPFPILFRLKFRYTNRQLEIFAVSGMIICNLLTLWVRWIPLLCVISYVCCYMKLMATFEIMSNIQLWMTPKAGLPHILPFTVHYSIVRYESVELYGKAAHLLFRDMGGDASVHHCPTVARADILHDMH